MAQDKTQINFDILLFFSISIFFIFFTNLKLVIFAPLLTYLFYKKTFISTLWISVFFGIIADIFSSSFFSLFTICYFLTTLTSYKIRRYIKESFLNSSLFVSIYSLIFSIYCPILFFIFDKKIDLSISWIGTDLIIMPILDGVYGFLCFYLPKKLLLNLGNLWKIYKKRVFQNSR